MDFRPYITHIADVASERSKPALSRVLSLMRSITIFLYTLTVVLVLQVICIALFMMVFFTTSMSTHHR